jgi:cell division initiation protein
VALTPVEIKHIQLERSFFGYRRSFVDQVLEDVAQSFEDVWRDRADLADRVEHLEGELVRFRELEALLRTTLVSAERASQELKDQARRESELVLTEAHAEARAIVRQAHGERERLATEAQRIRSLLRSALDTVELPEQPESAGEPALAELEEREAA